MPEPTLHTIREQVTTFTRRILNPEEAAILERIRDAQFKLGREAATRLPELEGTGHYDTLKDLLTRAAAYTELADTIETTPVELVPSSRKAWDEPEAQTFKSRLSRQTAQLLTGTGEWLKEKGYKLEAGRLRSEARELYIEAGAILGGIWGGTVAPAWASDEIGDLRTALSALEEYRQRASGESCTDKVKARAKGIYDRFGSIVTADNFRATIDQAGSTLRRDLIEFTAWGINLVGSFGLFIGILAATIIFVPPWGGLLTAMVLYVWSAYRPEVEAKMAEGKQA